MSAWVRKTILLAALALSAAPLAACGGPQRTGEETQLRPLAKSRALEVILEALRDRNVTVERNRRLTLANGTVEADLVLAGTTHAIEYIQESDRGTFPERIPDNHNPEVMLVCRATGPDAGWDLMLLDARDYRYMPDPALVGSGRPSQVEVEDRLRRTIIDYVAHTRRPH